MRLSPPRVRFFKSLATHFLELVLSYERRPCLESSMTSGLKQDGNAGVLCRFFPGLAMKSGNFFISATEFHSQPSCKSRRGLSLEAAENHEVDVISRRKFFRSRMPDIIGQPNHSQRNFGSQCSSFPVILCPATGVKLCLRFLTRRDGARLFRAFRLWLGGRSHFLRGAGPGGRGPGPHDLLRRGLGGAFCWRGSLQTLGPAAPRALIAASIPVSAADQALGAAGPASGADRASKRAT